MEFQMAPDTEAPSEMLIWFSDLNALCAAEDATHTFHNILTLRGAVVRDPHSWAKYLTESIDRYGSKVEVVFAQHHWPTWGNGNILKFLTYQRGLYAYVHDQTLRLLNKGYNGPETAEMLTLPRPLISLGIAVTLTGTAKQLTALAVYGPDPEALVNTGVVIDGDTTALDMLASLLDLGDPNFNIVTP
ncbi:alkyl/aryl-sulfatase BDS1 [Aspergillus flavus]|nr:alkyl/aryl-sulfatase BDS1 [Aspergillus flavus]RAQ74215.1 alkyl/aryl-sulfatase BDS1 [Aspergillus flavus]